MKKVFLFATLIAGCLMPAVAGSKDGVKNDTTASFSLNPPMVCHNCENKIRDHIRFEKGVKNVEASAKDSVVVVTFDKRKNNVEGLQKAFRQLGREATEKK